MAKKPTKNLAVVKQEEALKAQCKALYFEFATVESIHRKTGVPRRQIQNWIYGSGNIYEVDQNSWLHERSQITREEQEELMLRNKHLSIVLQSQALTEIISSLDELKQRKTKRGKKIPLSAFDMKQVSDTVLNVQKMNIVAGMNRNEDQPPTPIINNTLNKDEVIDMQAVAFAIKKDKAIMKLIEGSSHERNRTTASEPEAKSETTEIIRSYEARATGDDNRGATSEGASRERSAETSDRSDDAERDGTESSRSAHETSHDMQHPRAKKSDSSRIEAARDQGDRSSGEGIDQPNRDDDSAASSDFEFDGDERGAFEDGFADEYS